MSIKFNIEEQYQRWLSIIGLDEARMHPEQKKQLREAFHGALSQWLIFVKDEFSEMTEDESIDCLNDVENQLKKYWSQFLNKN